MLAIWRIFTLDISFFISGLQPTHGRPCLTTSDISPSNTPPDLYDSGLDPNSHICSFVQLRMLNQTNSGLGPESLFCWTRIKSWGLVLDGWGLGYKFAPHLIHQLLPQCMRTHITSILTTSHRSQYSHSTATTTSILQSASYPSTSMSFLP